LDKYGVSKLLLSNKPTYKIEFIQERCKGKVVLDFGCIRHNSNFALKDPNWLHKKIISVAKKVIGVDYLQDDVKKLKEKGYDIRYGDVTKPLQFDEKFDVIVAGDLIEHLTNFDGFFHNILRFLSDNGVLIVTTPNPFFSGLFFYSVFKKNIIVNPEHTCYICPVTLNQLISRYNLEIEDIYYIKDSWELKNVIYENEKYRYDILNDKWIIDEKVNLGKGFLIENIFNFFLIFLKSTLKLNDEFYDKKFAPYIKLIMGKIFNLYYVPFKWIFGLNSKFVNYSDYLAVIKRERTK